MELSRRFRALKLWLSLRYHGVAAFRRSIAKDLAQARRLANAIGQEPELELLAPVELSAVCFRYRGTGGMAEEEMNRFNLELLKRVVRPWTRLSVECISGRQVQSEGVHREPPHER
jgi:aromatic-L-amino-acid decarboxylase